MNEPVTTLWRPVGPKELALIQGSGMPPSRRACPNSRSSTP